MASPKKSSQEKKTVVKSKKTVIKKSVVKKASSKPKTAIKTVKKKVSAPAVASKPIVPQWVEEPASYEHKPIAKKQPESSTAKSFLIILLIVVTLGVAFFIFKPQINKHLSKKETATEKPAEIQPEPAQPLPSEQPAEQKQAEQKAVEQKPVEPKPVAVEPVMDPNAFYHEVQPKEQLTEISKKYYGTVARWQEIFYANKAQLTDPKKIYPGQKLIIPGKKK